MRQARTLAEFASQIMTRKLAFLGVFFVIMVLSYGFLYLIDFVPEPIEEEGTATTTEEQIDEEVEEENHEEMEPAPEGSPLPISLTIDALDRTVTVLNPESREINALDQALLSGVIRHPDSANFHETGNILILGHSSYLPTVFNRNFQALNGIQDLSWGDTIRLRSEDTEYIYRVERVYEAKASEVTVPNSRGAAKLTLATCNTFGAKEDRFIVEAGLVSSRPLAKG